MPTKVPQNKAPIKILFNTLPDYARFITFGCLCFPYMRPYNSYILSFRSLPCTFIGYGTNQKGYKCLTSERKVIISRHVAFNVFPFTNTEMKTTQKFYNAKASLPPIPIYTDVQHKRI